jgi:hypothetical protein
MKACSSCGCYCRAAESDCPHCGAHFGSGAPSRAAAALLLGLTIGLNGCPMQAKYGMPDTGVQAEYGVADTAAYVDDDGDGWTEAEGDCDDADPNVNPDAPETAGDDVDSDCDGDLDN